MGNWSETQELAKNIFDLNALKDKQAKILAENATVTIINASGNSAVADRIKDLLQKDFGYKNVLTLSGANLSPIDTSQLYDLTKGTMPFTLSELATKLPAPVSYDSPNNYAKIIGNVHTDILLVIGKDLITRYTMAKDSVTDYNAAANTDAYDN